MGDQHFPQLVARGYWDPAPGWGGGGGGEMICITVAHRRGRKGQAQTVFL
jgi:hypothetical protein